MKSLYITINSETNNFHIETGKKDLGLICSNSQLYYSN